MKRNSFLLLLIIAGLIACNRKTPIQLAQDNIRGLEKKVFPDSLKSLDKKEAFHLMKAYADYSEKFKQDSLAPVYLFKAGEMAMNIQMGGQAITYLNDVISSFPTYKKTPDALFLIAFIYETMMNNKTKAKETYNQFITKYPDNALAKDARISVQNIDIPLDQLVKQFEEKNKETNPNENIMQAQKSAKK
ncbi:MAG: tetratricopeptide repeat protein [Bacteroidia bacterium]|nr:tetratricopeptide repeat protein [Bacteroidia bacterium]